MSDKRPGALVWEPPVLDIEGKQYELRKLGLTDLARLLAIVTSASKYIDRSLVTNADANAETLGTFLIDWLPHAFDEIVAFLASVIGLDPGRSDPKKRKDGSDPNEGTMRDPDVFPISALPVLITKLCEHRNVVDFFAGTGAMTAGLKKLFGGSSKPSTESNIATDGPTSTSEETD